MNKITIDGLEIERPKAYSETGFVYFLLAKELGLVKIGFSGERFSETPRRFNQIQVTSPVNLTHEYSIPGTIKTESLLHEHFSNARVRGEWFSAKPVLEFVEKIRKLLYHEITHTA